MRKIFNTLETTPRCEAERLASYDAYKPYEAALTRDQDLKTRSAETNSELALSQKTEARLNKEQNANLTERERLEEGKKDADKEFKSYGSTCYIIPWYCGSLIRNYNYYVDAIEVCKDIAAEIFANQGKVLNRINKLQAQSNKLYEESETHIDILYAAETAYTNAYDAFLTCIKSLRFNKKLNNSCKQIKQKIKIINQKIISFTNQSLNVKYGNDSLPIMKINKKLSSSAVNTQKEILNELDKAKPTVPKEYLSLFSTFYKKTKDNLASYEKQKIMLEVKITKSKQTKENILVSLPKLEKALSNTIQKFVNCKTPPLI
jgi:hypothetical protein